MKALINKKLTIIAMMMVSFLTLAQDQKVCGTTANSRDIHLMSEGMVPLSRMRASSSEEPYKLAITAHIIRREDGTGGLTESQLESAIETVNGFYSPRGLEFFIFGEIDYVDSDKYFDYSAGNEVTLAKPRDVANTINIYFANTVRSGDAALCGYAYFPGNPDRIFMDNSCTVNGTTLSHEIGHYLTLYHTHGKTNNGTTDELVDGSNCETAGDDVCDTPADPNLTGKVNGSCRYTSTLRDANNDLYQPNAENIMSYAPQSCRRLFTTGQYERALSGYLSFRNYLISKRYNANFVPSQSVVCVGDEVNFSNLSLGEFDNVEWQFVNGTTTSSTEDNPTTSYDAPGSYDVQLTVFGTDGGTDVKLVENAVTVVEYGNITESEVNLDFETGTIADFTTHSPGDTYAFSIEPSGFESENSLSFQFFNSSENQSDDFILIDPLENPGTMDYVISFDYAFTYFFSDGQAERIDDVRILSKACNEWETIWIANGKDDATINPKSIPFIPEDQDWVHVEKYVPVEEASDFVQLAIQASSNKGNNFYIDNITISYANGIVIRSVDITNELCAGDQNGVIDVNASFNSAEISYSIDGENFQSAGLFSNLTGGSYQVTVKSGSETELLDLTVPTTSQVPAKPIIVFSDNELRLLSTAFIIEWYYNGELIDDTGTTSIPFNGNGNYQVIARNELGCENISDIFTILSSDEPLSDIMVYPNPASDYLKVRVSESTSLQITDLTGRVLIEQSEVSNEVSLDISSLPAGIYVVKGTTKNRSSEQVLVISR